MNHLLTVLGVLGLFLFFVQLGRVLKRRDMLKAHWYARDRERKLWELRRLERLADVAALEGRERIISGEAHL